MKTFGNISLNCDYQRVYCVYEQMLKLHGTAGRLVSHILLRLMQLIRHRLLVYCHMTLEGREVGLSVSLCGGTPAWHTSHRDKIVLLDHSTMLSNPIMYHCVRSGWFWSKWWLFWQTAIKSHQRKYRHHLHLPHLCLRSQCSERSETVARDKTWQIIQNVFE